MNIDKKITILIEFSNKLQSYVEETDKFNKLDKFYDTFDFIIKTKVMKEILENNDDIANACIVHLENFKNKININKYNIYNNFLSSMDNAKTVFINFNNKGEQNQFIEI